MYRVNDKTRFSTTTVLLDHPTEITTVYAIKYHFADEENKILNHELFTLYNYGSLYDFKERGIRVRNISTIKKITKILIKNKIIEWVNQ